MGMFDAVGTADVTQAGNRLPYFLEGHYKVSVHKVKGQPDRNGNPFFVVEAEILESNNVERPPGTKCSWVCKMNNDMGPINVKKFIAAANGVDPSTPEANEVTGEDCEYACSDEQPLTGTIMGLQCSMTTTKAGNPFTIHNWEAAKDESVPAVAPAPAAPPQ